MSVYAGRLNNRQRKWLKQLEDHSGFEPMKQDDFDAGLISFDDLWRYNIEWLENMVNECDRIRWGCHEEDEMPPTTVTEEDQP